MSAGLEPSGARSPGLPDVARAVGFSVAFLVSLPGAVLALLVAVVRAPYALIAGATGYWIPALYVVYVTGMAAGGLCVRAFGRTSRRAGPRYGLRALLALLGLLAATYLEYYFWDDWFPLLSHRLFAGHFYLVGTASFWAVTAAAAWWTRQSRERSAGGSSAL